VIVGWQDGADKSKTFDRAIGINEDHLDAIFDACLQAIKMYKRELAFVADGLPT
jgi:hypothetical protein